MKVYLQYQGLIMVGIFNSFSTDVKSEQKPMQFCYKDSLNLFKYQGLGHLLMYRQTLQKSFTLKTTNENIQTEAVC